MNYCDRVSVVIPSFNPTAKLEQVVCGLIEIGFDDIIVVNDGSEKGHTAPFERVRDLSECTVLTHSQNMGKGESLKTAFSFFLQHRQNKEGVVSVDSDGQHLKDDVLKCALAMGMSDEFVVMGVRNFRHPDVPKRNSIGNRITSFAFRALFGISLRDTQTGLRGIPARYIPLVLDIKGSRFEYETNMLLEFNRRSILFKEVEIETVYEEGSNARSQFRPCIDSIVIFSRIFKYSMSGIFSFVVDISAFRMMLGLLGGLPDTWKILCCTAIARAISSFLNFNINKRLVYQSEKAYGRHFWRYYMLVIFQMLVSATALWLLALLLNRMNAVWMLTFLKILVDTSLFFLSYVVQRDWVFGN